MMNDKILSRMHMLQKIEVKETLAMGKVHHWSKDKGTETSMMVHDVLLITPMARKYDHACIEFMSDTLSGSMLPRELAYKEVNNLTNKT